MKPMTLNMSKMKKIAGDKKSSTFKHEDGHEIKIAHSALPALQRKQLEKLPIHSESVSKDKPEKVRKYAEGGDTSDPLSQVTDFSQSQPGDNGSTPPDVTQGKTGFQKTLEDLGYDNSNVGIPQLNKANKADAPQVSAPNVDQSDSQSEALPQQGQPVQLPSNSSLPSNNVSDSVGSAYQQGQQAIKEGAVAQAQEQKQRAAVIQDDMQARQDLMEGFKKNQADILEHQKAFMQDYANGHIDADRYLNSMSTGKKISTAIGLFLGGFKQGLVGGENPAATFLHAAIDRDIDAQKAEMSKKHNLMAANQELFKDNQLAENATRMQLNDIMSHKIELAAAQNGSAGALAAGKLASSNFAIANANIAQQSALRATALHAAKAGGAGLADPSILVPHLVPEPHQKQVFSEIEAAQNTKRMGGDIMKAFEDAAKENTILRTGGGMLRTPGSVLALHQAMQPTFKDLEGTVRQAAMDNTFKNITPTPGDSEHKVEQKREALAHYLQSKASAPTAKAFGIDLNNYPTTTTQQRPQVTVGQIVDTPKGRMQVIDAQGSLRPVK